jgi:5-methylcytosine-specific restriction endonuclease McrA
VRPGQAEDAFDFEALSDAPTMSGRFSFSADSAFLLSGVFLNFAARKDGVYISRNRPPYWAAFPFQDANMKNKPNAAYLWKQLEDLVVPRLRLSVSERAVYYHLLRHSRLEGKVRCRFSIASLGRGTRLTGRPVREAVRRLVGQGALRLIRRGQTGHLVEVRVPDEIRRARFGARVRLADGQARRRGRARVPHGAKLEEIDFTQTKALRQAIHSREGGRCFYCSRRLASTARCVDHVVPRAQLGRNSYRNLVSCCLECNSQKAARPAEDFLRWLYRERRLTAAELRSRLRALDAVAAGKLRPPVSLL